MLKRILTFSLTSAILLATITTLKLSPEKEKIINSNMVKIINNNQSNNTKTTEKNQSSQNQIGNLIIKKINLNEPLYKVTSEENTISKHITILNESIFPNSKNSIIFLAAHSGTGKIAYFEKLDELKKDDEVILNLNNKNYTYFVKNIWEEKKNGYINVNKEPVDQLVLTTCSPKKKDYQLIVNCILKS